ncbi:MAG: T9SS type A sorting domain-containing protein [Bacteroidetes bacterium]|nr:T9SS type A sorting domain-containing protein [Bacteroidota bacterium]
MGTSGIYYVAFHAFVPNPSPVVGSSSLRVDLINLSIATAINENANPGGVSIFPNPSNGVVNLRVMKFENATIRVINILGKEIYNSRMSDINTQIDLSNFAKGLYIVKVDGTDFQLFRKLPSNKVYIILKGDLPIPVMTSRDLSLLR